MTIYTQARDTANNMANLEGDHLEEIYNKWPLLDDDIWCKLIIMERNRRIGKAYARVPIVTIDGSHELSYDGYKLALNGFDNPDRDDESEECRKRIGKGIRIKMDNFGNILIKRLSKAGVYVKEWINPSTGVSGGSSNSTNGSSGAGVGRSMPSRQQLIKAASMSGGPPSSSSGGSSMDIPNDSAICDEVITIGGRLDLDKIYVMFDIKKFQANITQELCRPCPDRRKLEQQCFSIVGLTRDSEDILNLPCWVMVINIVAIEMLNERFHYPNDRHGPGLSDFPDSRRLHGPRAPSFVSIFDPPGNTNHRGGKDQASNNREEDPYSLPANASSSDVKSSINDYGTTSSKNMSNYIESAQPNHPSSRFYGTPKNIYPPTTRRSNVTSGQSDLLPRHRSKSNYNIYGPNSKSAAMSAGTRYNERYNNSSSIYSPGHMLVPPSGDHSVPPKLPPRDFVAKKGQKSKSSINVKYDDSMNSKYDDQSENIYSTGLVDQADKKKAPAEKVVRKAKKNRFLESLKAPLELAKSSRSSASVIEAPVNVSTEQTINTAIDGNEKKSSSKNKSGGFGRAKNLRSFLGVGSKSKGAASDESNYVHLDVSTKLSSKSRQTDSAEADSVVDSNEEIDDSHQAITNSSTSPAASYNDLDIPTPDYETDENIYALGDGRDYQGNHQTHRNGKQSKNTRTKRFSVNNNDEANNHNKAQNKDDLYYSGFRAHVPYHHSHHGPSTNTHRNYHNGKLSTDDRMSCISGSVERENPASANSRYLMRTSRMLAAKMSGRDMIYGSTIGLQQQQQPSMTGSRYRSASMQRYYPPSRSCHSHHINRSHNEMYDQDIENPYAMSTGLCSSAIATSRLPLDDPQGHYGVITAASCIGGSGAGRRRSVSKLMPVSNRSVAGSTNHYDIERSSSGIYGNNSSSSSSEYADWHPQVRKVNSSGYLNSIFKSHRLNKVVKAPAATNQPLGPNESLNNINNNSINNNNSNSKETTLMTAHGHNNNMDGTTKPPSKVRNYASRTLKSAQAMSNNTAAPSATVPSSKKQQAVASSVMNGPTYRSYDSSNDSDPSYTNSSDGLDIYDQIDAHTRLSHQHHQDGHQHHNHNQFLNHNIAPEVHVGEWENLYDR